MKIHRTFVGTLLVLIPLAVLTAWPTVELIKPSAGQYGIQDLWKAKVRSDSVYHGVWFEGFVFEASHGQVFWAKTDTFTLYPGPKEFGYDSVTVTQTSIAPGYEAFVTRTGLLPSGTYWFKLVLEPFHIPSPPSRFVSEVPGPPRLIVPRNGDMVRTKYPQFVWTPPMPRPAGVVTYELKLFEVLPGQTPDEALRANPPWFTKTGIVATSLTYPTGARALSVPPGATTAGNLQPPDTLTEGEEEDTLATAEGPAQPPVEGNPDSPPSWVCAWQVSAFAAGTKVGESEVWSFVIPVGVSGNVTPPAVTTRDTGTESYHDSTHLQPYPVQPGHIYGVWLIPSAPTCSLVAIRYFFGDTTAQDTVIGFVNRVPSYPNGGSALANPGVWVDSFRFTRLPKGQATVVNVNPIPANSTSDFFTGWAASSERQTALWDSMSGSWPPRSYSGRWSDTNWVMSGLPGNLAISAVFRGGTPPSETGEVSIELRWNTAATDLDLYLVGKKDTIYWRKPKDNRGHRILDVDDTDGYGPEVITYSVRTGPLGDTMAEVGVYYYGPAGGVSTQVQVLFYRNRVLVDSTKWTALSPGDWWDVGTLDSAFKKFTIDIDPRLELRPDLSIPGK